MSDHHHPAIITDTAGFQGAELTYSRCPIKANEANQERHDSWEGVQGDGEKEGRAVSLAP